MANKPPQGELIKDTIQVGAVYTNLTSEVIKITSDKLKLILTQHFSNIEKRKEWWTPLSLLLTLLIIFPTTEFKDSLSFKASSWQAFFMMLLFLTLIWLVFQL